jgi:L-lactate dehydrogenase complex protein LldG
MSAREEILRAVRAARPAATPLPDVRTLARAFAPAADDLAARFIAAAQAAGARIVRGRRGELNRLVAEAYPEARVVVSAATGIAGSTPLVDVPAELAGIDLFVCEGLFGVAENGAVWMPASRTGVRAALFLAPHEVVVLDHDAIVADLHEACARLELRDRCFGAFVAGPSKTADIEQSLVIGAHGPKTLTVILVESR